MRQAVPAELLARYDSVGPRYTSYPTAVDFHAGYGDADYRRSLAAANQLGDAPLSVYTHIPFCVERCWFCGCHTYATTRHDVVNAYLAHLEVEMARVAACLPDRRKVAQYHLGGGTPTYLSPDELRRLVTSFKLHFNFLPGAELAIEVDPRVTTIEHIDTLGELGFSRISMGVQDFDPAVQEAIGRVQPIEATQSLVESARKNRFGGVNLDLIYGLPRQTPASFSKTVAQTLAMRPDRVAVYSFAYLPNQRGHQRNIQRPSLPGRDEKFALLAIAREGFMDAGYQAIGMDHFALPTDELSIAQRQGRLQRNFMGYTVMAGADMVGFGVSAIGDVRGALVQVEKKLVHYYRMLDEGGLPIARGYQRTPDDEIRRDVIHTLMCNFVVDRKTIESRHGIVFADYLHDSLAKLAPFVADGMCAIDDSGVRAVGLGQVFVRNLAMCFDAHLEPKLAVKEPVFSRTV
jgi:oxygen-independent coproporphyrinogen III oxidase